MAKSKRAAAKADQVETELRKEPIEAGEIGGALKRRSWGVIASVAGALLLFLLVYVLRLDHVVGQVQDDAWYVLLAQALATGQGYTLINSPSPGILPLYPPAFPWLLSVVYRLSPHFPQNFWLLKSVSMAAMLGVGVVAYYYLKGDRSFPHYLALSVAGLAVLNPALVFLATSTVMSECVFTFTQLLTILVIERGVRVGNKSGAYPYWALGAALASFTFLTRSMALGLILAVVVYLLKERLVRGAVIFAVGVAILVGPWMLYARLHAPTAEQRAEQGGHIILGYAAQFWQKSAGDITSGQAEASDLPERVWKNFVLILGHDAGMMMLPPAFRNSRFSGSEVLEGAENTSLLSYLLSALAIIGFFTALRRKVSLAEVCFPLSLAIILLWPWKPFRLVLPFIVFILFYFLTGIQTIYHLYQRFQQTSNLRRQWIALGVVTGCLLTITLYDHTSYLLRKYQRAPAERPVWIRTFEENEAVLEWVDKKLPKENVITADNPPLVYLYAKRKTVAFQEPTANWENWNRLGVRYLVRTALAPLPKPDMYSEGRYNLVYHSRGELNLRVLDFGPQSSRLPWGSTDPSKAMKIEFK